MFSVIFGLNRGEIQYVRDKSPSVTANALNENGVLASVAMVVNTLEVTAMRINTVIDDALYNFLYTP